ncbi:MAG: translation initiation factor IF-3 [Deltaproteobacteria bacterium RBG_13_52_11]|nr:MAG: translation initiation factor IF-3 [Deltaproteobacteria bacterium RBG_13_52_11]
MENKNVRVNRDIRAPQVRLIGPEGDQLGIVSIEQALAQASNAGLDLVEVSPKSDPPVCKIMDHGKYKYLQTKKTHGAKKKQASGQLKEVRMRPKTEEHDLQVKLRHVERFLKGGHKTKISIVFRGREMAHKDLGERMMERIVEETKEWGVAEHPPKFEGRSIILILAPH